MKNLSLTLAVVLAGLFLSTKLVAQEKKEALVTFLGLGIIFSN